MSGQMLIPYTCRDLSIRGVKYTEEYFGIMLNQESMESYLQDAFLAKPNYVEDNLARVIGTFKNYAKDDMIPIKQSNDKCKYLF